MACTALHKPTIRERWDDLLTCSEPAITVNSELLITFSVDSQFSRVFKATAGSVDIFFVIMYYLKSLRMLRTKSKCGEYSWHFKVEVNLLRLYQQLHQQNALCRWRGFSNKVKSSQRLLAHKHGVKSNNKLLLWVRVHCASLCAPLPPCRHLIPCVLRVFGPYAKAVYALLVIFSVSLFHSTQDIYCWVKERWLDLVFPLVFLSS